MHSPVSEVSLCEFVFSSDYAPQVLQLSPATFKSIVDTIVDLLVEQAEPAIIWAKLPKGDAWQADLDRLALNGRSKTVYIFKSQRGDEAEEAGMSASERTEVDGLAVTPQLPKMMSVSLPADSPLRREYFLLIWSERLQGGVLAQRSRLKPHLLEADAIADASEDTSEKKQILLTLCSFETTLMASLLEKLEQAIDPTNPTPTWTEQVASIPAAGFDERSLSAVLMKQLQKQEDLWQRSTTYRRQAEVAETLQTQKEELVNAVRLKDDFLSNVGQELRTPLTTIKTALSLLNSPSIKPPQRQRYMDLIAKECDRQSSLITSLLDLVQLDQMAEQTTMQPIRLADVVPGVVSTYQPLAEEKGIRLAYTVPEDLPPAACVNPWLRQIVINLLHNGIKFTPQGGQVWVRAKQQGEFVQLEIRDTGIGIAQTEIPKIFDRFYRVRQSNDDASGAGLGLTIVQQLLLHCSGSISVKSRIGEGSTFNVLLPIYKVAGAGEA